MVYLKDLSSSDDASDGEQMTGSREDRKRQKKKRKKSRKSKMSSSDLSDSESAKEGNVSVFRIFKVKRGVNRSIISCLNSYF